MKTFERDALRERTPFAYRVERDVRFQDIDAAGIVYYPRNFEYASDTFVSFLKDSGVDLRASLEAKRWGAPLKHVEADFLKPLRFGDRIEVALVRALLRETEFTLGFRIARVGDDVVTAVVQTLHVSIDPGTFERAPVHEELRAVLLPLTQV
jgi:YbgC/YbaW family acyl-CoA thioester hydrolase